MYIMGHYVYKYVYNDEIIYIGKSDSNLEHRIDQHKREEKFKPYLKSQIYYIKLANRVMSDVVESELIRRYHPKLNVSKMSEWCGLNFVEPEWIIFQPSSKRNGKLEVNQNVLLGRKLSGIKIRKHKVKQMRKELDCYLCMSYYFCPKILNMYRKGLYEENEDNYIFSIKLNNDQSEELLNYICHFCFQYESSSYRHTLTLSESIELNNKSILSIHIRKKLIDEVCEALHSDFVSLIKKCSQYYMSRYRKSYTKYTQKRIEYYNARQDYEQIRKLDIA